MGWVERRSPLYAQVWRSTRRAFEFVLPLVSTWHVECSTLRKKWESRYAMNEIRILNVQYRAEGLGKKKLGRPGEHLPGEEAGPRGVGIWGREDVGAYVLRGTSKTPSVLTSTFGFHMEYTCDLRMKPDRSKIRAGTWLEQDERLLAGCWSTCFSPDGDEGGHTRRARRAEAIAVRVARTKHVPGR